MQMYGVPLSLNANLWGANDCNYLYTKNLKQNTVMHECFFLFYSEYCVPLWLDCRLGTGFFNIGLVIPPCSYPFSFNSEKKTPPETLATAE